MKIPIAIILASTALLASGAASAKTAVCRDSNGHFTKNCPPAATHAVMNRVIIHRVPRANPAAPSGRATAKCKDGSLSYSKSRGGSCAGHGGVAHWM